MSDPFNVKSAGGRMILLLAVASAFLVLARPASSEGPTNLADVETETLIRALQQRDVAVPGEPAPAWTEIRRFTVLLDYRAVDGPPLNLGPSDPKESITDKVLHRSETSCDLAAPCQVSIPSPPGARKNLGPAIVTFWNRSALRKKLIADGDAPIGLDALRGDAVGLVLGDPGSKVGPDVKRSLTGRAPAIGAAGRQRNANALNPSLDLLRATPGSKEETDYWALGYSSFREYGFTLDRPHQAGGRAVLTVTAGDPAPGPFRYLLKTFQTRAIAAELNERGFNVDAAVTAAPENGHPTAPSSITVALTLQGDAIRVSDGKSLQSRPYVENARFSCVLSNEACEIAFIPSGSTRQLSYSLVHTLSRSIEAGGPVPGTIGFDRHPLDKNFQTWQSFDAKFGPVAVSTRSDRTKAQRYMIDSLMHPGFANQVAYPDSDRFRDARFRFALRVVAIDR